MFTGVNGDAHADFHYEQVSDQKKYRGLQLS